MRELFTRGLRGEAQKETEIGPVPESWRRGPSSSFAKFGADGTPARSVVEYWSGDIPCLRATDFETPVLMIRSTIRNVRGALNGKSTCTGGSILMLMQEQGSRRTPRLRVL